jgi:DNA transposition AAA+ family ATPase
MRRVIKTTIYDAVEDVTIFARTMASAGAVIGPPGIGKTFALEDIARKDPKAVYIRISPATGTYKAALDEIAKGLQIKTSHESAAQIQQAIEHHLQFRGAEFEGPLVCDPPILLIDEAQDLDLSILKQIVDFPYRFRVPVVVCGNADLLKRTRVRSGAYEQIASRVAKRAILAAPCDQDFQSIAVDFDVCGMDAHKACVAFGRNTSIRALVQMLEAARGLAGSGPLRLDEIKSAATWLVGGDFGLRYLSAIA